MLSHLDAFYSYSAISEEFLYIFPYLPEEQCTAAKSKSDIQDNIKEKQLEN